MWPNVRRERAIERIVAGRVVALFNVEGMFYALDGVCPHQGGPLGKGPVDGPDRDLSLARLAIRRAERLPSAQSELRARVLRGACRGRRRYWYTWGRARAVMTRRG